MKIFCINGIAESGKDKFVDAIIESTLASGLKTSTVDEVKLIAAERFGWDGVKDAKGRKLLATLRSAWGEYNDGPILDIGKKLASAVEEGVDVVFIMVREFPEMMKIVDRFGAETIVITRPGRVPCETEQAFLDMVPKDYMYDYLCHNGGSLEDWYMEAFKFFEEDIK